MLEQTARQSELRIHNVYRRDNWKQQIRRRNCRWHFPNRHWGINHISTHRNVLLTHAFSVSQHTNDGISSHDSNVNSESGSKSTDLKPVQSTNKPKLQHGGSDSFYLWLWFLIAIAALGLIIYWIVVKTNASKNVLLTFRFSINVFFSIYSWKHRVSKQATQWWRVWQVWRKLFRTWRWSLWRHTKYGWMQVWWRGLLSRICVSSIVYRVSMQIAR